MLIAGKEKEGYGIIIMTLDAGNQPEFFNKCDKISFGEVIKAKWEPLHYGGWYRMFKNAEDAKRYLNEVGVIKSEAALCVKCVIPEQERFIDDDWRYIRICDDPVHGYRTFDDLCTRVETYLAEEVCFEKTVYGMKGPKKVPDELLKRLLEELGFTVEIDG